MIARATEVVSFKDALEEMEIVVKLNLSRNKIIPMIYATLNTTTDEYEQSVATNEVEVNTKYKTMDKKVKFLVASLPKGNWQRIKEVVMDPYLRDPRGIGHSLSDKMQGKLRVGGGEFVLPTCHSL